MKETMRCLMADAGGLGDDGDSASCPAQKKIRDRTQLGRQPLIGQRGTSTFIEIPPKSANLLPTSKGFGLMLYALVKH
jgi:hypothetical protein